MYANSSLSEAQRAEAVALFETGHRYKAVASRLRVGRKPIHKLHGRWRIHKDGALVSYPTKRTYPFEVKLTLRRARSQNWSGCAGRTGGCGRRTPIWEKCGP